MISYFFRYEIYKEIKINDTNTHKKYKKNIERSVDPHNKNVIDTQNTLVIFCLN